MNIDNSVQYLQVREPSLLEPFIKNHHSENINMITNPDLVGGYAKQSKFYSLEKDLLKGAKKNVVNEIEQRLVLLKGRIKKQKSQAPQQINDLKQQLKHKDNEILRLNQIIKSINQSISKSKIFEIKISFYKAKQAIQQNIKIVQMKYEHQLNRLYKKIQAIERTLSQQNLIINQRIPKIRMSTYIEPLQQNQYQIKDQIPFQRQLNQKKKSEQIKITTSKENKTKIFIKNGQQRQFYKMMNTNGEFIQKSDIQGFYKRIDQLEIKIINLELRCSTNINKAQIKEESQNIIQSAKSFVDLLRKIQVMKVELVHLDSKANLLNQSISSNMSISKFSQFKQK